MQRSEWAIIETKVSWWHLDGDFIVVRPKTFTWKLIGSPNLLPKDWFRELNCILGNLEPKITRPDTHNCHFGPGMLNSWLALKGHRLQASNFWHFGCFCKKHCFLQKHHLFEIGSYLQFFAVSSTVFGAFTCVLVGNCARLQGNLQFQLEKGGQTSAVFRTNRH